MSFLVEKVRTQKTSYAVDAVLPKMLNELGWDASAEIVEAILARIDLPTLLCKSVYTSLADGSLPSFEGLKVIGNSQRIWGSIASYVNDYYRLRNCKLFPDLEGKLFSELSNPMQRRIKEKYLDFIIIDTPDRDAIEYLVEFYTGL